MCAWTFGLNQAQQYHTNNVEGGYAAYDNLINANLKLDVTVGSGSPYHLVQQQYVTAPPKSQCAMTPFNLPSLPAPTVESWMTFYNAFSDSNQYYVVLQYTNIVTANTKSWISPKASYGQHVEFSKMLAPGTRIKAWLIVRASDDKVVLTKNSGDSDMNFPTDSVNSNLILLWAHSSGKMLSAHYGTPGMVRRRQ
jgi:hypothetical protein